jgi:F-type H+-transporting ATPase subunit b
MEQTLRQLGGLLLGSVPTAIFLLVSYGLYRVLVHGPLTRVLAERRSKTEGAIEMARAAIASADARMADYEGQLREARLAMFKVLEARRQQSLQKRESVLAQVRARAQAEIEQARAAIEQDKQAAKAILDAEAESLASEIIRVVLQPAVAQAGRSR